MGGRTGRSDGLSAFRSAERATMDIEWLEDFLGLIETRNFSRSAEIRHTTQPALSRRIRRLEDWVGAPLFDRSTQPISLTPSGERFRLVAESTLRQLYQGRDDARRELELSTNTVRFTATHSLSLNFFPQWLHEVELRSQTFSTRLDTAPFAESVRLLTRGGSHFMISYTHARMPMGLSKDAFVSKVLLRDRLLPVTLPDAEGRALDQLPGTPDEPVHYVAYSEAAVLSRLVESFLSEVGEPVYLNRVFVSQMTAILKAMITAGRGMAWLPESHLEKEFESGQLVLAGDERWFFDIAIRIIRPRDRLPPAAETFWSLLSGPEDADWG